MIRRMLNEPSGAGSQLDSARAGRIVLDEQVQRAVLVELQLIPVTDGIAVDRVRHEELLHVVHRHRPEGVGGRVCPLSKWIT